MHAISQLQRDIRFQELVLPGQSGHCTHGPSIISCPDGCIAQSSPLPLTAPHTHGAQHLICPTMPTHHSQRSSNIGKGNKWQARPKTTSRQQIQHAVTQSTSGYLPFATGPTAGTKLVLLNDTSSLSASSAQTLVLSPTTSFSHHPAQPQQTNALVPVLQNGPLPVSYYILDAMAPNLSQSQPSIPCVISAQAGGNNQPPFYNYTNSSVVVTNSTQQQPHQRFCYQQGRQYSPAQFQQPTPPGFKPSLYQPPQQTQIVPLVFQPPPRERVKSPGLQIQDAGGRDGDKQSSQLHLSHGDLSKLQISTRSPRYQSLESRHNASTISGTCVGDTSLINSTSLKQPVPVVITSAMSSTLPNNGDLITSIQSTWLATQPLGNMHLVMGMSTGSTLKSNAVSPAQDQFQSQEEPAELPSPIARPQLRASPSPRLEILPEEDKQAENKSQTQNLLSDSSTSFDYTIEAEKMVSALCSSTPLKDLEDSEDQHGHSSLELNGAFCDVGKIHSKSEVKYKSVVQKLNKTNEDNEYEHSTTCKSTSTMISTENSNEETVGAVMYFPCSNKPLSVSMSSEGRSISNTDISQYKSTQSNLNYRAFPRSSSRSRIKDVGILADKLCGKNQSATEIPSLISKDLALERNTVCCQTDPLEERNKVRCDSFREDLVKGCDEISEMLRNQLPSPTLNVIINFCIAVKNSGIEKATDNCNRERELLKKLILSFLRVASCWLYLNSEYGIHDITELMSSELNQWFQQWQSDSVNLMECMLKNVTATASNSDLGNNSGDWGQPPDMHHLLPSQTLSEANAHMEASFSPYHQTYASTTLADGICNANQMLSGPLIHNAIPSYLSSSCDLYGQHTASATSEQLKYYVSNTQTNARHWRQRRFSDNQTDALPRGMRKQKGSYVGQKEGSRPKWGSVETGGPFQIFGDQKFSSDSVRNASQKADELCTSIARSTHGDHPSGPERYSRQSTGHRIRQKSSSNTSKRSSPRGTNLETKVQNKVTENLDGVSKQWQIYRKNPTNEFQIIAQPSKSGQIYNETVSAEQCDIDIPKAIITPLSQIEKRCHSADNSQQVDISDWFKNIAPSLTPIDPLPLLSIHSSPEITNHLAYANVRLPYQQCLASDVSLNQQSPEVSTTSAFVPQIHATRGAFSYQDSRNHIGSKNKTSQNKRNINYIIKPPLPNPVNKGLHFLNQEEPDSSDETQDRVYMKPGSYDVPKRTPSVNNRSCIPLHVNNTAKVASSKKAALAYSAVAIGPPTPRRSMDRTPKLPCNTLRTNQESLHLSDSKLNGTDTSDRVWKAACLSAESILGSLEIPNPIEEIIPKTCINDQETAEVTELINGMKLNRAESCNGTAIDTEALNEASTETDENILKNTPSAEKRKLNVEKTDHWLIRTFKLNVGNEEGKDKSDNESPSTENSTLSTPKSTTNTAESLPQQGANADNEKNNIIEKPTVNVKTPPTTDKKKCADCPTVANGIVRANSSTPKSNCGKKGVLKDVRKGDEDQQTSKTRKSSGGGSGNTSKRSQESGRSTSASRKRKLHERSPNSDMSLVTGHSEAVPSHLPSGSKAKAENRGKSMWSVWYSSRRRRGLSQVAALKLETILNGVWNMEESEFIKYPISLSEYNKIVKHPMFLQTIAYKLRNRIYETIEQFVHDFRRVFYNSKIYNREDSIYGRMTKTLKDKFDLLLEDQFSGWDFAHITGSPSEQSHTPSLRYLAFANSGKSRRAKSSGKTASSSSSSGNNTLKNMDVSSTTTLR